MTCDRCSLCTEGCNTVCVKGRGKEYGILNLFESPSAEEDAHGYAGCGKDAEIAKAFLEDAGLLNKSFFSHAIRCKVPYKRKVAIDEIRNCRKYIDKDLRRTQAKAIIAWGTTCAKAVTDSDRARISNLRGQWSEYRGIPVFYTNHPAAVQYDRKVKTYIEEDLKKFVAWWKAGCPKIVESKMTYLMENWPEQELEPCLFATLDIETNGLDPYVGNEIKCLSVATSSDVVYYKRIEPEEQIIDILDPLRNIVTLCCHNSVFDMAFITKDLPQDHWIWDMAWEDTMIALQFVDETYPNTSLDHLAQVYCKTRKLPMPDVIKQGFPPGWDKVSDYRKQVRQYNCNDSICTYELAEKIRFPLMKDPQVWKAYRWASENLKLAVRMRHSGIHLSQKRLDKLYLKMTGKIRDAEKKLISARVDIHSTKSLKHHLFNRLGLPVLKKTKTTREPALSADVLEQLKDKDKTGWVKTYLDWKQYGKTRDTYCTNLKQWGRIAHPRVFVARYKETSEKHGTNTGRITCEGFINLPREGSIKRCLTSRYGKDGVILCVDYSQMEMRVLADIANDKRMKKAFIDDVDLHKYTASEVFEIPLDKVDDEKRQKGKRANFSVVYGTTEYGFAKKNNMTLEQAVEFLENYKKKFNGVGAYIKSQTELAVKTGIVYSPLGRPFHLPNAKINDHEKRKSVNSPIQEGANAFCTEAAKQQAAYIQTHKLAAHVILMVYDSVVTDWHKSAWEFMGDESRRNNLFQHIYVDSVIDRFGLLGWNITTPIKFDMSFGHSLGECK